MPEYIMTSLVEQDQEPLIRCRDCRYWQTGIAYAVTGRCENDNMPDGLICNSNFFCGYGEAKA